MPKYSLVHLSDVVLCIVKLSFLLLYAMASWFKLIKLKIRSEIGRTFARLRRKCGMLQDKQNT